ncbi:ABC transporter ATP-binding protein [Marinomonas sp. GJ51-6]|nr:ABC transporter ATP-binding protein [Marinomonas sp. GJ51-6]WOD08787.1 ABC transporter ATP-binding protein [Marinomonas sp. GJ51-6]
MDSSVHLDNTVMQFGDFTAIQKTDLKIESGEFFSFLGPSGCGKTTILNMISGFLDPTQGDVRIGGQSMKGVPANKRPTSMIFQNLALFPLMTVAENIEFGLEVRGVSKSERKRASDRLLELVALEGSGEKKYRNYRVAKNSVSRLHVHWRLNHRYCCLMSLYLHWI